MIPPGTQISVELPEREGEVLATVIKCSSQGRSCTLQLQDTEEEVHVNISKCKYSLVEEDGLESDEEGDSEYEDAEEGELDVFRELEIDSEALDRLIAVDPSQLLQRSEDIAAAARNAAKELIDYAAKQSSQQGPSNTGAGSDISGPALYVDGFDAEQIWLQLDMLSAPALKRARKQLKKSEGIETLVAPDVEEALDELLGGGMDVDMSEEGSEEDDSELEDQDYDSEDNEIDYEAMLEAGRKGKSGQFEEEEGTEDEEESDQEDEEEEEEEDIPQGRKRRRMGNNEARAAVEDDFMKLDEMEAFLQQAERAALGEEDEEEEQQQPLDDINSDSDIDDDALGREQHSSEDDDSEAEEAELEALLDNAAGLVGRKRKQQKGKRKKNKFAGLSDSEDEDDEDAVQDLADDPLANATYEDFFGPRKATRGGAKGRSAAAPKALKQRSVLAEDPSTSEDEYGDEDDVEGGSDEEEPIAGGKKKVRWAEESDDDQEEEQQEEEEGDPKRPSTHQRRLDKVTSRIKRLEEEAMAEKPWWMQGEVIAGSRPKNSALEIDLDFETTAKPPPAPTEESTRSLEDLIKARVADGRFDDPIKFVVPGPEKKSTRVELDDKKSAAGLAELYEKDYVAAVTGAVEDKDAPLRELAKAQFQALSAALDALSHGHFRPVPSIEEVTVKVDVPAILMEEAAPAFVSAASMRAPEEVYKAGTGAISAGTRAEEGAAAAAGLGIMLQVGGGFKSEAELTKEDRKRRRADKKRASKKRKAAIEETAVARAAAKGEARVSGRKSEEEQQQLRKLAKAARKSDGKGPSNYSRSTKVFGMLQAQRDAVAVGGAVPGTEPKIQTVRASGLKL